MSTSPRGGLLPHHLGFGTITASVGVADCRDIGPADSTVSGSKASKPWLKPTFSAMWAGSISWNRRRQSVYGWVKTTVTVRPSSDGVIEATSRYPTVVDGSYGCPSTSWPLPRWLSHA